MRSVLDLYLLRVIIVILGMAGIIVGAIGFGPFGLPVGAPIYLRVLSESSWIFGFGAVAILIAWKAPDRSVLLAGLFLAKRGRSDLNLITPAPLPSKTHCNKPPILGCFYLLPIWEHVRLWR